MQAQDNKITSVCVSGSDSVSPTQFRPYHESPDLAPGLTGPVTNDLESYGAPAAEVVTSYQETQPAPALDNYGSPQAPVVPAYTAPRSVLCSVRVRQGQVISTP